MRTLKLVIIILLTLGTNKIAFSQINSLQVNEVSPIAPNAASFAQYGGYNDELYTGNVSVNVPIYTLKDGDLSLSVSLNTTTGAIKVSEVPGWVGSGWNLSTGGVITRKINHLPDDLNTSMGNEGYFYNESNNLIFYNKFISRQSLTFSEYEELRKGNFDLAADDYYFNIPGYSGRFTFILDTLIMIPDQKISVIKEFNQMESYVDRWILTTPDGVVYSFKAYDRVRKNFNLHDDVFTCYSPTTWYLESIKSPKISGGTIEIYYTEDYGKRWSETVFDGQDVWNCNLDMSPVPKETSVMSLSELHYVERIVTSNAEMDFITSERTDLPFQSFDPMNPESDKKLDTIKLFNKAGALIKMWKLMYNTPSQNQRLQLLSISELSPDKKLISSYSFEYDGVLDAPFSSRNIDHWGYYNYRGYNNESLIPERLYSGSTIFTRDPYFSSSTRGSLKIVYYPTGGSTTFIYEPHDGLGSFKEYSMELDTVLEATYDFVQSSVESVTGMTYTVTEPSLIEVFYACSCDDPLLWGTCSQSPENLLDIKNRVENVLIPYVLSSGVVDINQIKELLPIHNNEQMLSKLYISVLIEKITSVPNSGGIRIKKIINSDGSKDETKSYRYRKIENPSLSSAVWGSFPIYSFELLFPVLSYCPMYPCSSITTIQGSGFNELSCTQNSNVGYSVVTELINDSIRTDFYFNTFSNHDDLASSEELYGFPAELGPVFSRDYLRGKLIRKDQFVDNKKIRSATYNYSDHILSTHHRWTPFTLNLVAVEDYNPTFQFPCVPIITTQFETRFNSERLDIDSICTIDYGPDETPLISACTMFEQTDFGEIRRKTETNSNNDVLVTEYTYPSDHTEYQDWGIYNMPISETRYLNNSFQERIKNVYETLNPLYTVREYLNNGNLISDTLQYYDEWGYGSNLIQTHKNNDLIKSYIWGYYDQYPIAVIENSSIDRVAFTSFEDQNGLGGWNAIQGIKSYEQAKTGRSSYYNCVLTFSPEIQSEITVWAKGNAPTITGYTALKLSTDSNGWSLYKWIVNPGIITLQGSSTYVDELRLIPIGALITTYTYDSLVGITSITTPNCSTVYYEYDNGGRLQNILNNNRDIVKHMEYNYVGH